MQNQKIIFCILLYSCILAGWFITSFGVLIPYYSQSSSHDQTYYSFLFIVKSVAEASGSLAIKYAANRFTTQTIFICCYALISLSLFICSLSLSIINLTTMLYFSGMLFVATQILVFSLTIKIFQKDKPEFWLVIVGFFFGIGATISPLATMYFQLETYKVLSGLSLVVVLLLLRYPLPELEEKRSEEKPRNVISSKTEIYICLVMLILPAQQIGFASWLPTYSIKSGISTTDTAAVYSFYFWLPNSVSRIIWAFFFKCSVTWKLKVITTTVSLASLLLIVLQHFQLYNWVCTIGPLVFGFMLACVYAFCLALPLDNGYDSTTANSANFVLANCIGEGIFSAPIGYSMRIFGFQSLILIISGSSVISCWSYWKAIQSMKENSLNYQPKQILLSQIK